MTPWFGRKFPNFLLKAPVCSARVHTTFLMSALTGSCRNVRFGESTLDSFLRNKVLKYICCLVPTILKFIVYMSPSVDCICWRHTQFQAVNLISCEKEWWKVIFIKLAQTFSVVPTSHVWGQNLERNQLPWTSLFMQDQLFL